MVFFFIVGNDFYFLVLGLVFDLMNRLVKGGVVL